MHFVVAGVISAALLAWVVLASRTQPLFPSRLGRVAAGLMLLLAAAGAGVGYATGLRFGGVARADAAEVRVATPPAEPRQPVPFPMAPPGAPPPRVAAAGAVRTVPGHAPAAPRAVRAGDTRPSR